MDRQQFLRAGLGVGAAAAVAAPAAVAWLAPTQPARIPSVVDMTHVADVRAAADAFAGWDARYGGGLMREAVAAQLRYCVELLNVHCCEAVRGELFTAVGSFAETAGYMAYDDFAHDDARRMYRFALAYTESALVRAGRLTATERALLHNSRARDLAKLGETQDAMNAVGAADEAFSHTRPGEDPPWMASYTEARNRLSTAVATRADGRGRTGHQLKLARLIMATGDPREAAALGTQALDRAATLRSGHVVHGLRDLRRLAEPHAALPEVTDLRDRIRTMVAAA